MPPADNNHNRRQNSGPRYPERIPGIPGLTERPKFCYEQSPMLPLNLVDHIGHGKSLTGPGHT